MSIIIDPEFQSLIPPLSKDEYTQLEKNIVKDGIRDALIVWPQENGNSILIDGHNRFQISAAHAGIRFEVREKNFKDRDEAIVWIADNQLGKRNLPLPDKVILQDKKRDALARMAKKNIGGDHKSEDFHKSKDKNSCPLKTRQEKRENSTDYKIAKAAGTSEDTVRKVRTIKAKSTPETWNQVRSGEKSINQAFNEIKEKERKRLDISARASLREAEERHDDFKEQKTVSMDSIQQDKKDSVEIAKGRMREIYNSIKKVLFIGASGQDYSVINKKNVDEDELRQLKDELNSAISILMKIRETIGMQ